MKKCILVMVLLTAIANTNCGFVEGLFGTMKNTRTAIKEDIGGALSYGRSLVFGNNHEEEAIRRGEKPAPSNGLLDTISLGLHDAAQGLRERFRSILAISDGNGNEQGILGRLHDRISNRLLKIKGFLFGNSTDRPIGYVPSDTTKIKDCVNKVLNTSTHPKIRQLSDTLKQLLDKVRNDAKNGKDKNNPEVDGTGLIDIRMADDLEPINDNSLNTINGLDAAYDKVDDEVKQTYNRGGQSVNEFKQRTTDFVYYERKNMKTNVDKIKSGVDEMRSKVDDSVNEIRDAVNDRVGKSKREQLVIQN